MTYLRSMINITVTLHMDINKASLNINVKITNEAVLAFKQYEKQRLPCLLQRMDQTSLSVHFIIIRLIMSLKWHRFYRQKPFMVVEQMLLTWILLF